jgi:hypothetical protein
LQIEECSINLSDNKLADINSFFLSLKIMKSLKEFGLKANRNKIADISRIQENLM